MRCMQRFVLAFWERGLLLWSLGTLAQEKQQQQQQKAGSGTCCNEVRQSGLALWNLLKLVYAEGWGREMTAASTFFPREGSLCFAALRVALPVEWIISPLAS